MQLTPAMRDTLLAAFAIAIVAFVLAGNLFLV